MNSKSHTFENHLRHPTDNQHNQNPKPGRVKDIASFRDSPSNVSRYKFRAGRQTLRQFELSCHCSHHKSRLNG